MYTHFECHDVTVVQAWGLCGFLNTTFSCRFLFLLFVWIFFYAQRLTTRIKHQLFTFFFYFAQNSFIFCRFFNRAMMFMYERESGWLCVVLTCFFFACILIFRFYLCLLSVDQQHDSVLRMKHSTTEAGKWNIPVEFSWWFSHG